MKRRNVINGLLRDLIDLSIGIASVIIFFAVVVGWGLVIFYLASK